MSEPRMGYLYRMVGADAAQLTALIEVIAGPSCWAFGGASLWDFDSDKPERNLRPITQVSNWAELDLKGDFGHSFSLAGEVRWKRRGRALYDALVLRETVLERADLESLGSYAVREVAEKMWMYLEDMPGDAPERGQYWRLGYLEYLADSRAVRFVRYTQLELREEPR